MSRWTRRRCSKEVKNHLIKNKAIRKSKNIPHLAHVSSSNKKTSDFNSIDSTILAAILVEPEALLVLKDRGSTFAASGRLSIKGEISTPKYEFYVLIDEVNHSLLVIDVLCYNIQKDVTDWDSNYGESTQMLLKKTQIKTCCHIKLGGI